MSNMGFGVMIGFLGGNEETVNTLKSAIGKTISSLSLNENKLHFRFSDGTGMVMYDDGQSCCEERYMSTDDNLLTCSGEVLVNIELADAPNVSTDYDEHEVQFLIVKTDKSTFTFETHNIHNGYYGGFWIVARPEVTL